MDDKNVRPIWSCSYKTQRVIAILIVSIVVYIPIIMTINYQENQLFKFQFEQIKSVSELTEYSLASALKTHDKASINFILDDLRHYKFIYRISVLDAAGSLIADANNFVIHDSVPSDIQTHTIPIFDNRYQVEVGSIIVSFTHEYYTNTVGSPIQYAMLFCVYFVTIGILISIFALSPINRRIDSISHKVQDLAKGKIGVRFEEECRVKEICELSQALNSIAKELDQNWSKVEKKEQAYKLKSEILQVAAHELRTPIASIKTYIDIAISHITEGRNERSVVTLTKAFSDITTLDKHITAILCLSSLENNSLTKNETWLNINEFFETINNPFRVKCKSFSDKITWSCYPIGDSNYDVLMDRDLVSIIISNAIDNAIKYTNIGFVKVSYKVDLNTQSLYVCIHDSGVGISEEHLTILKQSPEKLARNIKATRDGWGIGMSTMQKFTDFLNGNLIIESKQNFGTKIHITLPLAFKKSPTNVLTNTDIVPSFSYKRDALENVTPFVCNVVEGGINVLVIDNDQQHIKQMQELLSPAFLHRNDVSCMYCYNAVDAIRNVEEHQFDLLLIDYHMPSMDGYQFLEFLSNNEHKCLNATKIILTADASIPPHIRESMDKLSDRVMSKGVTTNDIKDLLRQVTLKSVG